VKKLVQPNYARKIYHSVQLVFVFTEKSHVLRIENNLLAPLLNFQVVYFCQTRFYVVIVEKLGENVELAAQVLINVVYLEKKTAKNSNRI